MKTNLQNLDKATIEVMKKMLTSPPKPHEKMKVGQPSQRKKKRDSKDRASSAKQRNA